MRNRRSRAMKRRDRELHEAAQQRQHWLDTLQAQQCPACESKAVANILYGLPRLDDEMRADINAGRIVLGGCDLWGADATQWVCRDCGQEWR